MRLTRTFQTGFKLIWLAAGVIGFIVTSLFAGPVQAQDDNCFVLPNGIKFCRPQTVSELTQCVRNMERHPNRPAAEACRLELVSSCRTVSDQQFEQDYAVRRPRLIDAKAAERTPGWNKFCPSNLGYRYTPVRQPARNQSGGPAESKPDKDRKDAIREAGGNKFLIEPFEAAAIPSLPSAGPCLCNDNTKPVFGFCTGNGGTYKPSCARK